MLDKLQVSGAVKNYLISIDKELSENYREMVTAADENLDKAVGEFVDGVVSLLDYYAEPMFESGQSVMVKKAGLQAPDSLDVMKERVVGKFKTEKLERFSHTLKEAIVSCFDERENDEDLYDEIIAVVVAHCLRFFKLSQLEVCAGLGIEEVSITSSRESCPLCQTRARFKHKVQDLLANVDQIHPYCKLSFETERCAGIKTVVIPKTGITFKDIPSNLESRAKNIAGTLRIYVQKLMTDKEFVFADNIFECGLGSEMVKQYGENKANELRRVIGDGIVFYENGKQVAVSTKCGNVEYVVTLNLLKDKLMEKDTYWWRDEFAKRGTSRYAGDGCAVFAKPFVSYAAEQNWESYFLESAVFYILEPRLLKEIDPENYEELKTFIFEGVEFMRG